MKRLLLISTLFSFFIISLQAQEVISSAGEFQEASTGSLSWTLGETITETYRTDLRIITQGFNQSQLSATATYELPGLNFNLSAYPNPASDFIILDTDQMRNLKYQIYSVQGEFISEGKLTSFQTRIDFQTLIPSTYIIRVYENNIPLKLFKIVKL